MPEPSTKLVVIKIGGSLYDLPGLATLLPRWLAGLETRQVLLIPGGGKTADAVRNWDQLHGLGEERSHWLAIQALSLNARFLAAILHGARLVDNLEACESAWHDGCIPILDPAAMLDADEGAPDRLPHSWNVSSDSIAARIAILTGAVRLILLKSADTDVRQTWGENAAVGLVDPLFPILVEGRLDVEVINFRNWYPTTSQPTNSQFAERHDRQ